MLMALGVDLLIDGLLIGIAFTAGQKEGMAVILAFGLAALLFLVTEELLVEAHEEPETRCSPPHSSRAFCCSLSLG